MPGASKTRLRRWHAVDSKGHARRNLDEEDHMSELVSPRRLPAHEPFFLRDDEPGAGPDRIRKILHPSDLSLASERSFDQARLLAERFDARVTLYHVVEASPVGESPRFDVAREAGRRAQEAARQQLERRAAVLHVPHTVVVYPRRAVHRTLVRYITVTRPDLVVMATHGREGLAHLVLGSLAETVLQQTRRPVLCVRPDHGVALAYRRILVPTDFSTASRRAFPMAASLARAFEAEVVAVHVAPQPHPSSLSGIPELVENAVPDEKDVWEFLQPDFGGLRATVRVPLGLPWEGIVGVAHREKADVIVMCTRGHDSLADRLVGSQTERVVRHSPCPVLAM
jgi:nucleotide-binding universal stress UspA family protein